MRRSALLLALPLAAGCAVASLPGVTALKGQSPHDQGWDVKECRWAAQRKSHYDPNHSPAVNFIQDLFFWGTVGAVVGGTVAGAAAGDATEGLIAGAGAGGITSGVMAFRGQRGFERVYVACLEGRGYSVATVKQKEEAQ